MYVNAEVSIPDSELEFRFILASGPGGQNVNKVATAVQLRFDVAHSPSLPDAVRQRLLDLAGTRVNKDGVLVISAKRYRTQEQNRRDARDRLLQLLRRALQAPKQRRKTRPSRAAREKRLQDKRLQSRKKRGRANPSLGPDSQ